MRIPGRYVIEGNKKADELARRGSDNKSYGPESLIPKLQSLCDKVLRD